MRVVSIFFLSLALLFPAPILHSSDHADPIDLPVLESGITGLFAFPDEDQMVVILNVRRSLITRSPYQLEPYEFAIHMDLHSQITYDNAEHRTRYGGTIPQPDRIRPDATIKLRLNNDATLKEKSIEGLRNPENIRLWTGVRDDPFIFPRFFEKNVISMVLSIPFSAFPEDQKDWILWGTSTRVKDGTQIDHVGRANRTQLGRFDFLNTLPPSEHVMALREKNRSVERIQSFLMDCIPPLGSLYQQVLSIRPYDYFPDVMIFTKRYPAGFPNGRQLTDDIAQLTCKQGDCPLIEFAFIDSQQWPRATTNDKAFMDEFPYLAKPWPAKEAQPTTGLPTWLCITLIGGAVFLVVAFLISIGWFLRGWRNKRAKT